MISRGGKAHVGEGPRWDAHYAHMIDTESLLSFQSRAEVGCSIVSIILRFLDLLSDSLQKAAPFPELCVTSAPGSTLGAAELIRYEARLLML